MDYNSWDEETKICTDKELKPIHKEISDLYARARDYEKWLLENTQENNWFEEKTKYDDILFRLDQKKQKLKAVKSGNITVPETKSLPARVNRNRGF